MIPINAVEYNIFKSFQLVRDLGLVYSTGTEKHFCVFTRSLAHGLLCSPSFNAAKRE